MMREQVDVGSENLTSHCQVDDDLEFYRLSGCARRCILLYALADIDHQTTAS